MKAEGWDWCMQGKCGACMVEAGWWREVEEVWKGETDGIEVYRVDGHGGG